VAGGTEQSGKNGITEIRLRLDVFSDRRVWSSYNYSDVRIGFRKIRDPSAKGFHLDRRLLDMPCRTA